MGSFVVPTYTRHPVALAQQALTAASLAGGRLTLGIGLSHRVTMEGMLGFDWGHPIRHMHDYLACLLPLLRGEAVEFQGAELGINAYSLAIPDAAAPPVLVAALGPQLLRLTGRRTDGTALWMGGPRYLSEHVVPVLNAAARETGHPAPRILAGLPVCVTDRPDDARAHASTTFERYGQLPSYRAALDREGAAGPAEVSAGIRRLAAAGATSLAASVFALPGADPAPTYGLLQEHARAATA